MLLKEAANCANAVLRGEDVLARLGGDEFVVLLRVHDSGKRARRVAERIRQSIASIEAVDGNPVHVTASVGMVVASGLDADRLGAERILHEADLNMYAAKKDGKNQIVLTTLSSEIRLAARRA
jgi:diguanylate cyclase (GGDEF)-like protein